MSDQDPPGSGQSFFEQVHFEPVDQRDAVDGGVAPADRGVEADRSAGADRGVEADRSAGADPGVEADRGVEVDRWRHEGAGGEGSRMAGGQPPRRSRRRRFRAWRRSRPFWGGLLCLLGGLEIALIPLTAYRIILVSHSVALAALVGTVIAILGALLWTTPAHNKLYGLVALVLALVSFVTSNVGGFLLGGLLAIIGGALGFAWDVVPQRRQPEAPQP